MKTYFLGAKLFLCACAISLLVWACTCVSQKSGDWTTRGRQDLTPADEKELNDILAKYDTKLYRIDKFKDGELDGDPKGDFGQTTSGQQFISAAERQARKHQFSQFAVLFGVPHRQREHPGPLPSGVPHHPTPTPPTEPEGTPKGRASGGVGHATPTPPTTTSADEFLKGMQPVLQKYGQR